MLQAVAAVTHQAGLPRSEVHLSLIKGTRAEQAQPHRERAEVQDRLEGQEAAVLDLLTALQAQASHGAPVAWAPQMRLAGLTPATVLAVEWEDQQGLLAAQA